MILKKIVIFFGFSSDFLLLEQEGSVMPFIPSPETEF